VYTISADIKIAFFAIKELTEVAKAKMTFSLALKSGEF